MANKKNPLVLPEEVKNTSEEQVKEVLDELVEAERNGTPPQGYITIRLESNGRLTAPKVLHFRDYTMDEALMLDVPEEKDQLKGMIQAYSNMCWEEFDCAELHINELMQILYNLHGVFIDRRIEKEYMLNPDLPEGDAEGQRNHKSNFVKQDIPVSCFKTKSIDKDKDGKALTQKFKEPFKIHDNTTNKDVYLRFSRVKHMIKAYDFCDLYFHDKMRQFAGIKREIRDIARIKNEDARNEKFDAFELKNYDEWHEYMRFTKEYDRLFLKALQCQAIIQIDDKKLESIEDQLKAMKEISILLWGKVNHVSTVYDFGLLSDVTFKSDHILNEDGKPTEITRGFQFRPEDFIPSLDKQDSKRFSVSFD